ncbi:MAG: glycine--tRNA ligase [bacterium]|jgi:glycyl-tRNA synthetase|nr:glycine--tRNA ligase [bacterium]
MDEKTPDIMDKLVSLCKRRGFIFPSSEIYGGLASCWDYGPLGVELKNNLQRAWWTEMTRRHDNIVGLDASILMRPEVWQASGHVDGFVDPLVDCKECRARFRADQIDPAAPCPNCGGALTEPRQFNLMFRTHLGPLEDTASQIYIRPETAQGIYVDYLLVQNAARLQVPFGIAQVGKAFRNEIKPGNFIFRTCEFEQMEMQFFVKPGSDDEWMAHWKEKRMDYYRRMGIRPENLRFHQHGPGELAHYAREAWDVEYLFPFGWQEVEGIHNRTDFDLKAHQALSGKKMDYIDSGKGERYMPYIIETSSGLNRTLLMFLCDAYREDVVDDEPRVLLALPPRLAPITFAVLPLVKKDGIGEMARALFEDLCGRWNGFYDHAGAIGRRYRRMDEVGTPFCFTVDYDSKTDGCVTVRHRDSCQQERVKMDQLKNWLFDQIEG